MTVRTIHGANMWPRRWWGLSAVVRAALLFGVLTSTVLGQDAPIAYQNFDTWAGAPNATDTFGLYTDDGWVVSGGMIKGLLPQPLTLPYSAPHTCWLRDTKTGIGAAVRTPLLPDGAGILTFQARNLKTGYNEFDVQSSPDGVAWTTLDTIRNESRLVWTEHNVPLNTRQGVYLRILKTADGNVSQQYLGLDHFSISPPPEQATSACQDFDFWPGAPETTDVFGHVEDDGWVVHDGRIQGLSSDLRTFSYSAPYACWLQELRYSTNAFVRTPFQEDGVGTLYFFARNRVIGDNGFKIQVSMDGTNWTTLAKGRTDSFFEWREFEYTLNVYDPVYVRILKTDNGGAAGQYLGLDDICLSEPPRRPEPLFQDFDDWPGAPTNTYGVGHYVDEDGWEVNNGLIKAVTPPPIGHPRSPPHVCWLDSIWHTTNAYIRTPLLRDGAGTMSFWARNYIDGGHNAFAVQRSVDGADWTTLVTFTNVWEPMWVRYDYTLNTFTPVYLRILKVGDGVPLQYLEIDDIEVSLPVRPEPKTIRLAVHVPGHGPAAAATNGLPYGEAFEAYLAGTALIGTADGWTGTDPGAARVVNALYDYAGERSMETNSHTAVCQVTDAVTNSVSGTNEYVYVDLMVKPGRWPDGLRPAVADDEQLALYVNANGRLALWCRYFDDTLTEQVDWVEMLHAPIGTSQWVRLALAIQNDEQGWGRFFQVRLDGAAPLTHYAGWQSPTNWGSRFGSWFRCADPAAPSVPAIAFTGQGYVDDLVVTQSLPVIPVFWSVTASADAGSTIAPTGIVVVAQGSNLTFAIAVQPGFVVTNVVVDGAPVGATNGYTFANVSTDHTIRVTSEYLFGARLTQNFDDWAGAPGETAAFGDYMDEDWEVHDGLIKTIVPPPIMHPRTAPHACWLTDTGRSTNACVRTPWLAGGAGWLSFWAKNYVAGYNVFEVQRSADGVAWITVAVFTNRSNIVWTEHVCVVNAEAGLYLRILKTLDNSALQYAGIDDIAVAVLPTKSGKAVVTDPDSLLPNWWVARYPTAGTADAGDPDGDGMRNWQEYVAHTDPGDPDSVLKVRAFRDPAQSAAVVIEWASEPGVIYVVQRATDLAGGFSDLTGAIPATAPLNRHVDSPAPAGSVFYRVHVVIAP